MNKGLHRAGKEQASYSQVMKYSPKGLVYHKLIVVTVIQINSGYLVGTCTKRNEMSAYLPLTLLYQRQAYEGRVTLPVLQLTLNCEDFFQVIFRGLRIHLGQTSSLN